MPPHIIPQPMPQPPRRTRLVWPLFIICVVVLCGAGYVFWTQSESAVINPNPETVQTERAFTGTLFVTLAPMEGSTQGIYALDMATRKLSEYMVSEGVRTRAGRWSQENALYVASDIQIGRQSLASSTRQIVKYVKDAGLEQITRSPLLHKRLPTWSAALEGVVFGVRKDGTEGVSPREYEVYFAKDGTEQLVTEGSHPVLSPDGRTVLVVREDGIYQVDLLQKTANKTSVPVEGSLKAYDHIALSVSGNKFAFARPDQDTVMVYAVTSWAPLTLVHERTLSAKAYWPVFSPDETLLAVERVVIAEEKGKTEIAVFDLHSGESWAITDVSRYDHAQTQITDWK